MPRNADPYQEFRISHQPLLQHDHLHSASSRSSSSSLAMDAASHPDRDLEGQSSWSDVTQKLLFRSGIARSGTTSTAMNSVDGMPSESTTAAATFCNFVATSKPFRCLARLGHKVCRWMRGPSNPQPHVIHPLLPRVQRLPIRLAERLFPTPALTLMGALGLLITWALIFFLLKNHELQWDKIPITYTSSTNVSQSDVPQALSCGSTFWGSGSSCGLNGELCRPFSNFAFPFNCPGGCDTYQLANPHVVGPLEINYDTFVIGGPPLDHDSPSVSSAPSPALASSAVYRGDSFICTAAIHLGVISAATGGCGVVRLIGNHTGFAASTRNSITSIPFDSSFPLAFSFDPAVNCFALDLRWVLLPISAVFTAIFALLFTAQPAYFFFPVTLIIGCQIGFSSDQPLIGSLADLVSVFASRALPAGFCLWVIYKVTIRRALVGLTAPIELAILWLGPGWVGALTEITFDHLPIQRLTSHDLKQQPGAYVALAIVIAILFTAVLVQAWFYRQEGRLLAKLRLYGLLLAIVLVFAFLPGLNLRIHHYVLALLLLPGTDIQSRLSLIFQGLLVGLFLNGTLRWGFDSVLQTGAELLGDAQLGSLLPTILPPVISLANVSSAAAAAAQSTITFSWGALPASGSDTALKLDGISALVNDVERYLYFFGDHPDTFVWSRPATNLSSPADVNEYFRFAYLSGSSSLDYTSAGTWTAAGEWIPMVAKTSRIDRRAISDSQIITGSAF